MATKYPGEKLLDPSSYGFDEYLVIGLTLFVVLVAIKHVIFHTIYFWWYREGQFYLPNMFWSFVSGKTLTQRLMKYISTSIKESTVSVEELMSLMDIYFKTKEFAPSLSTVKGKVVDDIVMEYQPKEVLVVGCHVGYVLLQILKSLPGNARIFVVESDDEFSTFSKLLLKLVGQDDKVIFVNKELNKATLESFKRDYSVKKFDFVFLNRTNYNQPSHVPLVKLLEGDSDQDSGYIYSKKQNGLGSVILADKVVLFGDPEFLKYVRLSEKYETKYYQMALEHSSDEIVDGMEKAVLLSN